MLDRIALILCRFACWLMRYHQFSKWWQMTDDTDVRQCSRCWHSEERPHAPGDEGRK